MDKPNTVYEEDIENAVTKAVGIFGPQGRMLYGEAISYNVKISTNQHGVVWYGDLENPLEGNHFDRLETALGVAVFTEQEL